MQALVLVGGEGTRLRPLTYDIPKPMLPVVGSPMIGRVVEWLARYGVERVVFSLGYRADAFTEFLGGEWAGVELDYAVEAEPLDTAGAVRFGAIAGGLTNERILVINGDILTDLDLEKLVAFHGAHGGEATISLTPVEDPSAYGVVPTDPAGRVLAFIEKPPRDEAPTNFINAGTYVLEPSVLDRIASGRRVSIEREVFPALVADGQLYAQASDTYWLDTGTPERYLQAHLDVLAGLRPEVTLPSHVERDGLLLGEDAQFEGVLRGRAFCSAASRVERGAELENSIVCEHVCIESGARLVESVVLEGARVAAGAVVERSIVGPRAVVGAAARLSSLSVVGVGYEVPAGVHLDSARLPE